jgi:hypothetical protein
VSKIIVIVFIFIVLSYGFTIIGTAVDPVCNEALSEKTIALTDLTALFPGGYHTYPVCAVIKNGENIYVVEGMYLNYQRRFIRSFDAGSNWNIVFTPTRDVYYPYNSGMFDMMDSYDGVTIYLAGDDGVANNPFLWKSTDKGSTWSKTGYLDTYPVTDYGIDFFIKAFSNDIVYVVYTRGTGTGLQLRLSKTFDGGSTWTSNIISTLSGAGSVYFLDMNNIVATGTDSSGVIRIYKTSDGGSTWSYVTFPLINSTVNPVIYAKDPNIWYIVMTYSTDLRLYKTTDSGSTWTYTTLPIDGTVSSTYGWFSFLAYGSHFIVLYNDTTQDRVEYVESFDEGQTWSTPYAVTSSGQEGYYLHGVIDSYGTFIGTFRRGVGDIYGEHLFLFSPKCVIKSCK